MKRARIFWFTGLSGSGKTTVALTVKKSLEQQCYSVYVLDGDQVRERYHRELGFSPGDIKKNNKRIARMCGEIRGEHDVILVPVISPFRRSREQARRFLSPDFYEVYFNAGLECVMERDVKGLYARAKRGEIDNLIGFLNGPVYEPPGSPDFIIDSERDDPGISVESFHEFVISRIEARGN